ncbi:MAG: ATP-binding protein [Cyclobacteriaceae bacterium]
MKIPAQRFLKIQSNKLLNSVLILASTVGSCTYLVSLLTFFKTGFELSFITDFCVIASLIIATYYRKKLDLKIKSYLIVLSILVLVGINVYEIGIMSANLVLLILLPFLAVFTFSIQKSVFFFITGLVMVAIIGYLHVKGYIIPIHFDHTSIIPWLVHLAQISTVAIILFLTIIRFNNTYDDAIRKLIVSNQELKASENKYHNIFNATRDAFLIFDIDGKLVDYNQSLLILYGTKSMDREAMMKDLFDSTEEYSYGQFREVFDNSFVKEQELPFWKIKRHTGEYMWVSMNFSITEINGVQRIICVITDIDEKKKTLLELESYKDHLEKLVSQRTQKLEKANKDLSNQKNKLSDAVEKLKSTQNRLVQSEKMAALGFLSSGLAHEMNNPLNIIKGGTYGIRRFVEANLGEDFLKKIQEILDDVDGGVDRASKIVSSLNMYSSAKDVEIMCDIHSILNIALSTLKKQMPNDINIVKQYDPDLSTFYANPKILLQTFLNVLTNGIQAIKKKGEITIKTVQQKDSIVVSIKDTGAGIEPELVTKISDPFFTTKTVGKGIGMGLYVVYNNMKFVGGQIEFETKKGHGTTVHLTFPIPNY